MNIELKTRILASEKSQLWIAREVGISEAQLSKIVRGWICPTDNLKKKIADVLGCEVGKIFP